MECNYEEVTLFKSVLNLGMVCKREWTLETTPNGAGMDLVASM